jgi:hypothetical protein
MNVGRTLDHTKPKQEVNKLWCWKTLEATSCSPPNHQYSGNLKTVGKSTPYCFAPCLNTAFGLLSDLMMGPQQISGIAGQA